MPEPYFSNGGRGQDWFQAAMGYKNAGTPIGEPSMYGMLKGDASTDEGRSINLRDQQMMDLILAAMLSDKGLNKYKSRDTSSAKPPTPTPPPVPTPMGDLAKGVQTVKKKKTRQEEIDELLKEMGQ